MENLEPITPENNNQPQKPISTKNSSTLWQLLSLILLLTAVGIYFWKDYKIQQTKEQYAEKATEVISQNSEAMLKAFCKPLAWTMRAELLRDNQEQMILFSNDLVKSNSIDRLSFVDMDGKIVVSTDKSFEGKAASSLYDISQIRADSVLILKKVKQSWEVSTPVTGYDKRLGTLIFNYKPAVFEEKQ